MGVLTSRRLHEPCAGPTRAATASKNNSLHAGLALHLAQPPARRHTHIMAAIVSNAPRCGDLDVGDPTAPLSAGGAAVSTVNLAPSPTAPRENLPPETSSVFDQLIREVAQERAARETGGGARRSAAVAPPSANRAAAADLAANALLRWRIAMKHAGTGAADSVATEAALRRFIAEAECTVRRPAPPSSGDTVPTINDGRRQAAGSSSFVDVPLAQVVGYVPSTSPSQSEVPRPGSDDTSTATLARTLVEPTADLTAATNARYKGFRGGVRKVRDRTRAWYRRNKEGIVRTAIIVGGAALVITLAVFTPFGAVILVAGVGILLVCGETVYYMLFK